jgi:hypothetical protein
VFRYILTAALASFASEIGGEDKAHWPTLKKHLARLTDKWVKKRDAVRQAQEEDRERSAPRASREVAPVPCAKDDKPTKSSKPPPPPAKPTQPLVAPGPQPEPKPRSSSLYPNPCCLPNVAGPPPVAPPKVDRTKQICRSSPLNPEVSGPPAGPPAQDISSRKTSTDQTRTRRRSSSIVAEASFRMESRPRDECVSPQKSAPELVKGPPRSSSMYPDVSRLPKVPPVTPRKVAFDRPRHSQDTPTSVSPDSKTPSPDKILTPREILDLQRKLNTIEVGQTLSCRKANDGAKVDDHIRSSGLTRPAEITVGMVEHTTRPIGTKAHPGVALAEHITKSTAPKERPKVWDVKMEVKLRPADSASSQSSDTPGRPSISRIRVPEASSPRSRRPEDEKRPEVHEVPEKPSDAMARRAARDKTREAEILAAKALKAALQASEEEALLEARVRKERQAKVEAEAEAVKVTSRKASSRQIDEKGYVTPETPPTDLELETRLKAEYYGTNRRSKNGTRRPVELEEDAFDESVFEGSIATKTGYVARPTKSVSSASTASTITTIYESLARPELQAPRDSDEAGLEGSAKTKTRSKAKPNRSSTTSTSTTRTEIIGESLPRTRPQSSRRSDKSGLEDVVKTKTGSPAKQTRSSTTSTSTTRTDIIDESLPRTRPQSSRHSGKSGPESAKTQTENVAQPNRSSTTSTTTATTKIIDESLPRPRPQASRQPRPVAIFDAGDPRRYHATVETAPTSTISSKSKASSNILKDLPPIPKSITQDSESIPKYMTQDSKSGSTPVSVGRSRSTKGFSLKMPCEKQTAAQWAEALNRLVEPQSTPYSRPVSVAGDLDNATVTVSGASSIFDGATSTVIQTPSEIAGTQPGRASGPGWKQQLAREQALRDAMVPEVQRVEAQHRWHRERRALKYY